jgi:hypothetical protein
MRLPTAVIVALAAGLLLTAGGGTLSLAGGKHPGADAYAQAPARPTYDECFKLGWVRGVHVERGEWDDFYAQCAAGQVPFASGMGVDSVRIDHERRTH